MTASSPLFYTLPRPLDRARDLGLRIKKPQDFSFAAKANAIPLLPHEFSLASASYPIVFAGEQNPMPAVAVGLRPDENLFLDQEGKWAEGAYIPAYVRRYPFLLMEDPANNQFIFCIDEKSPLFSRVEGLPLFYGDKPSDFTQNAMKFCADLQQHGEEAGALMQALGEQGVLVRSDFKAEIAPGKVFQMSGIWAVDPKKFEAVPNDVFNLWRQKGWVEMIYAHLFSLSRWPALVAATQARLKAEEEMKKEKVA